MKRILFSFFFFFVILSAALNLQAQNSTAFRKNYNLFAFDIPSNIIEGLVPNNYMLCGSDPAFGITIVSQLNDTGNVIWSYNYSASSDFLLNDIKKDISGNQYYLVGGSEVDPAVFMLLDNNGNILLSKKFIISEADGAVLNRVIKTSDGGYVAVGYVTGHDPDGGGAEIKFSPITYTDDDGQSRTDYIASPLIVKFDASGNHVWHKVFRYYYTSNIPANRIYNDASFSDVVEVSDGYVAVGSYDVNEFRSVQNSDSSDATPTDALILKTTVAGAITYHKQVDNPNPSTSQSSKYLSAVNKTSAGDIISVGNDGIKELIQKYNGSGAFVNSVSRLFTYSFTTVGTCPFCIVTPDPGLSSQIYEVSGSSDLITIGTNIKPLAPWANSLHRVNSTATTSVLAKTYDFAFAASILPVGSLTSDGGYIMATMNGGSGGTDYDFHVIKTDNNGDTPLTGCPANSLSPSGSAGPTTFADPFYNSWSGTPGSNAITITKAAITLPASFVCTKIACSAPLAATTVTATPSTICQGVSTSITASGPSSNVTYNVYTTSTGGSSIGSTPLSVSPSSTATYYVETAQESDPSCVSTSRTPVTVTVNPNPVPTISASGATSFCQGGSVTLTANSTESISNYLWTGGATSPSINVTTSGSYSVTITHTNGCSNSSSATTVTVNSNPSTPLISASGSTTFCEGNNVTLTSSAENSYSWSTGATTQSINVSNSGTYSVTVTNAGGCTASSAITTVTVNTSPTTPTISASGPTTFCQGGNVTLTSSAENSYLWSTGATTQSINVSNSGTYSVTVTNAGGCTNSSSATTVTVNNNPTPTISASGATTFCEGGSVTLTSSAANLYDWSNGSTTQNINVNAAGNYSVTVTDGNNCTGSSSATTVTVEQNPIPIVSGASSVCSNANATYSATNTGNAFLWSISNGTINSGQNTNSVSVTWNSSGAASISVTETSSSSCTGNNTMNVTINSSLNPTITASGTTNICAGNSVTLDAGSGYSTYLWANTADSAWSAVSDTITVIDSGTYSVTVTDGSGCSGSSSSPVTITVNNNPSPTIIAIGSTTFCEGDSVLLDAGSGFTSYLWNTTETTQTIYVDSTGSYSVTVTDGNGCTGSSSVATNIIVNSNPIVTITSDSSTTFCSGDSIMLNAGSGYSNYLWNTSDTTQSIVVNSSGNYSVSVTDSIGCSNDSSITSTSVTVNPNPVVSISGNVPLCSGDTVFLTATGGNFYFWSNGDTTSSIQILISDIYFVTVTDTNNCYAVDSADVNFFLTYNIPIPQEICEGDTYTFNGNNYTTDGIYYDTLSTVNGCDSIIETTLTVNPEFIVQNPQTICEGGTYTFNGNNYTVAGIYYDTLQSAGSCDSIIETNLTVNQNTSSTINLNSCDSLTYNSQTYFMSGTYSQTLANANGCDSIITLNLIINQSTSSFLTDTLCNSYTLNSQTYNASGTYTQMLANTAGCDSIITLNLTLNFSDTVNISQKICSGETYIFGSQTLTNPGNYSALFFNVNGCDSVVNLSLNVDSVYSIQKFDTICSNESIFLQGNFQNTTGIYYDTLQSINNCDSLMQTNLTVLPAPNPDSAGASPTLVTIFFRDSTTLFASGNGNYFWSPSDFLSCINCANPIANPDSTTVYYLMVSAANGCVLNDSVVVKVEYPPSDVFVPNIFSPNNDLQNDILYVYGRYVDRIEWTIFDRWGEKVFYCEGKKEECGWDGKYKGKDLNPAVFVYYLKVTLFDKSEIFKQGNVTLVK